MQKRLLDFDPVTQTREYFHYDVERDAFTIERIQETDPIVEANKRDFNDASGNWRGDMHKIASIPMDLWSKLNAEGIATDPKRLKKWLNDPDNRFFRTKPGKV